MDADRFQNRYQVHEYPGRKPWYIIRKYIERYSRPGEVILDPFCGSGVVPCEALVTRRRAVALDIDPLAVFVSRMTCISPIDLGKLQTTFSEVEQAKETIHNLYVLQESCAACGHRLVVSSAARMPDIQKVSVKAFCPRCDGIHNLVCYLQDWENNADKSIPYWYPGDVELPAGIRGNIRYLHELYTNRNLIALSILWHTINLVKDKIHRDILRLCFSATLSKASRINVPKVTGKGWTAADYDVYNIPDNFIEFNVWDGFSNKFHLCLEAKAQTNQLIGDFYASGNVARILRASADSLTFIYDNSIDYTLTDPPYADAIRYCERNFVRNTWLGFETECSEEYSAMMRGALRETHRVLKPGRYLSVLLKGTSQQFRDEFASIAGSAGFIHRSTEMERLGYGDTRGEPSDHVLNFVKSA
jgi:16S rRNA G966 N2-methylase RsmD